MVASYNDEHSMTNEEFTVIKTVINNLLPHVESIMACDLTNIKEHDPSLYMALVDLQESLDSSEVIDAIEMWEEEINN
jgi:hypothetical protein